MEIPPLMINVKKRKKEERLPLGMKFYLLSPKIFHKK
jgi:hypothetical protein